MKKNKKVATRNSYRQHIAYPELVDMDTLTYMNDDELSRRLDFMSAEREKAIQADVDPQPWEHEICYVQREVRIRNARRLAHDKYLRAHPEAGTSYTSFDDVDADLVQLN